METMSKTFTIQITSTDKVCGIGEETGRLNHKDGKIPVFSCEGGCIKGEIARLTANLVAKDDGYARACHGELFSVPHSELANWVKKAKKVVIIDGCSIQCHKRIAENIIGKDKLVDYDALSIHRKYGNLMDIDDVSETERKETAQETAQVILASLKNGNSCSIDQEFSCGSCQPPQDDKICSVSKD